MGVISQIGFVHRAPGAFRIAMQRVAATRFGAWFFSKTVEPMDRVCRKLTKGRTTVPELLAGLPVVFVTSTGRKSGQRRTHPLVAVPYRDDLALIGTNFGGKRTPGWVFNLEADPSAHVEFRNAGADVKARPATDDERVDIWAAAGPVYLGYDKYRERISNREVRIFVLEPSSP